jgi:AraC-like DNA-binding protein
MIDKLHHALNWLDLAREANWSVTKMAKQCGISTQTLHRYFVENLGESTKCWVDEQRLCLAVELLCECYSIKETAYRLGYEHQSSFTRAFKKRWGICPSACAEGSNCPKLYKKEIKC